ncbi:MAG: hypothetical protein Q8Q01_01265 [archaeon]|nr:hypothetical protein [archaeon]
MKYSIVIFSLCILLLTNSVMALTINSGVVLNTTSSNSSVIFSFNINSTNFTIEPSYILIYGINFVNNTGTYTCDDVNYSAPNSNLDSSEFNCALQTSDSSSSNSGSSGGGGSSYHFYEENRYSKDNTLEIKVKMRKNTQEELEIYNPKETSIIKLIINSKNDLSGEIKFLKMNSLPLDCNIPENSGEITIYKIIQINSTINKEDLTNVSILFDIDNPWIAQNSILKISGVKCLPYFENIKSSFIKKETNSSLYNFVSNGFSTWVIFGINGSIIDMNKSYNSSEENHLENDIIKKEINKDIYCFTILNMCWYWWLTGIILFLVGITFIINFKRRRKA